MPPALSATSLPPGELAPADRPAPAPGRVEAHSQAGRGQAGPAPAASPQTIRGCCTSLTTSWPRSPSVGARRQPRAGTGGTSFADIRAAFTVLRHALDLPGPARNGDGARQGRRGPRCRRSLPARRRERPEDGAAAAHGDFSDIRAAFASLRDVSGLPAPDGHALPAAPGPDAPPGRTPAGCWTRPPQRRRPAPGGTATPGMAADVQDRPGRAGAPQGDPGGGRGLLGRDPARHPRPGFARTLAARVSLAVSGAAPPPRPAG